MTVPSATGSTSSSMSGMMGMSGMMMVFFTSTTTPLYSKAWTPSGAGTYAGTCIFLIALSFVFRGLLALRFRFSELWARRSNESWKKTTDLELGAVSRMREPWRINKALVRAILDTVLAGVSYLL
jgi:copper transporter 1